MIFIRILFKSSLSLFEKCLKEEIITDNKFVTYLSGIVYYQLILRNFININIKDVSLLYHDGRTNFRIL